MTAKTGNTQVHGTTPDRAHPEEPAAAPLGTDDEAAGATGPRHPAREPASAAPKSRSPLLSIARWRQLGAALLLVLLIVAVFAVPILLR